jgi:glycosyltransferase involved in cell wall biosynthesis
MKPIVFHFVTGLEIGGCEVLLVKMLPKMTQHTPHVVCLRERGELGKELESRGVPVHYLDAKHVLSIGAIRKFRTLIKHHKPQSMITHLPHADLFGRVFGRLFGIKKIYGYLHSVPDKKFRRLYWLQYFSNRLTSFLVPTFFSVSPVIKESYLKMYHFKPDRILVVPNGIEITKFQRPVDKVAKLKSLNLTGHSPILGCVAKLRMHEKGQDDLLKAFKMVRAKFPNARLLLIGDGPDKSILQEMAQNLKLEDSVLFLGNRNDIPELLGILDLMVMSTRLEGMSTTILESLAAGTPIVTTSVPGNTAILTHLKEAYLAPPREPEAFARAILTVLQDKSLQETLHLNALKAAESFDIQYSINLLDDFLKSSFTNRP